MKIHAIPASNYFPHLRWVMGGTVTAKAVGGMGAADLMHKGGIKMKEKLVERMDSLLKILKHKHPLNHMVYISKDFSLRDLCEEISAIREDLNNLKEG